MRCNAGTSPVGSKCPVKAGDTITVEMHEQPGDRSCDRDAIGGNHYGPVMVYMSKVSDASTADGSAGFFKVFEGGWAKNPSGASGDGDFWGVKDMNRCCGRVDVPVPAGLANGDYLVRAEVIALHTAGSSGGAQFYMTCYQITVTGGTGTLSPATVNFPGAYSASDPGILVNIHGPMSSYTVPGPAVISAGRKKTAGSDCTGCEQTCKVGSGSSPTISSTPQPTGGSGGGGGGGGGGCSVAEYQQCGGQGFTGCTSCASGLRCVAVSPPHYSQCQK